MILASLDLGTNSFRLLISEYLSGKLTNILKKSVVTGLGKDFNKSHKTLNDESIKRSLQTIKEFAEILKGNNISAVKAVTTSIVRECTNPDQFTIPASKLLNCKIDILSGEKESYLTALGVLNSVEVPTSNNLIVDIGGGSTEYAYTLVSKEINGISIDIGVVKVCDSFDLSAVIDTKFRKQLYNYISSYVGDQMSQQSFECGSIDNIIITAGTPTTLAAIDLGLGVYDHDKINGYKLDKNSIVHIFDRLCSIPSEERLNITGLEAGREDLIIAGIIIVLDALQRYGMDYIIVSDGGLLEGVMHNQIEEISNNDK